MSEPNCPSWPDCGCRYRGYVGPGGGCEPDPDSPEGRAFMRQPFFENIRRKLAEAHARAPGAAPDEPEPGDAPSGAPKA